MCCICDIKTSSDLEKIVNFFFYEQIINTSDYSKLTELAASLSIGKQSTRKRNINC